MENSALSTDFKVPILPDNLQIIMKFKKTMEREKKNIIKAKFIIQTCSLKFCSNL